MLVFGRRLTRIAICSHVYKYIYIYIYMQVICEIGPCLSRCTSVNKSPRHLWTLIRHCWKMSRQCLTHVLINLQQKGKLRLNWSTPEDNNKNKTASRLPLQRSLYNQTEIQKRPPRWVTALKYVSYMFRLWNISHFSHFRGRPSPKWFWGQALSRHRPFGIKWELLKAERNLRM